MWSVITWKDIFVWTFLVLVFLQILYPGDGGLFHLRNITIAGYFYYLILSKLLHKLPITWISHAQQDANTQD
jgi:hypothetical protein